MTKITTDEQLTDTSHYAQRSGHRFRRPAGGRHHHPGGRRQDGANPGATFAHGFDQGREPRAGAGSFAVRILFGPGGTGSFRGGDDRRGPSRSGGGSQFAASGKRALPCGTQIRLDRRPGTHLGHERSGAGLGGRTLPRLAHRGLLHRQHLSLRLGGSGWLCRVRPASAARRVRPVLPGAGAGFSVLLQEVPHAMPDLPAQLRD